LGERVKKKKKKKKKKNLLLLLLLTTTYIFICIYLLFISYSLYKAPYLQGQTSQSASVNLISITSGVLL
jgi:flagellar basal body-associated protein FliL